ncbi:MAG: hypothetical protein GYB65_17760, partial [Chloroflexi bacterium]|nr:hypothetical protein [Chloroflexota bacterium]
MEQPPLLRPYQIAGLLLLLNLGIAALIVINDQDPATLIAPLLLSLVILLALGRMGTLFGSPLPQVVQRALSQVEAGQALRVLAEAESRREGGDRSVENAVILAAAHVHTGQGAQAETFAYEALGLLEKESA